MNTPFLCFSSRVCDAYGNIMWLMTLETRWQGFCWRLCIYNVPLTIPASGLFIGWFEWVDEDKGKDIIHLSLDKAFDWVPWMKLIRLIKKAEARDTVVVKSLVHQALVYTRVVNVSWRLGAFHRQTHYHKYTYVIFFQIITLRVS